MTPPATKSTTKPANAAKAPKPRPAAKAPTEKAPTTAQAEGQDGLGEDGEPVRRGRGRPRRGIDREQVADVVEALFEEGGYDAVSIEETAKRLTVSRATLYRTVPSKEHLLAILFERMTTELYDAARVIVENTELSPRERLDQLVRAQIDAAFRQRNYLLVFFGGGNLPAEDFEKWQTWRRKYEGLWLQVISEAVEAGDLPDDDPKLITRLLTGMTTWVARWVRPNGPYDSKHIADVALRLVLPEVRR
jgi:AcrR family transcriptional regulator